MNLLVLGLSLLVFIGAAEATTLPKEDATLDQDGRQTPSLHRWQKPLEHIREQSALAKRANNDDNWLNKFLEAPSLSPDWRNRLSQAPIASPEIIPYHDEFSFYDQGHGWPAQDSTSVAPGHYASAAHDAGMETHHLPFWNPTELYPTPYHQSELSQPTTSTTWPQNNDQFYPESWNAQTSQPSLHEPHVSRHLPPSTSRLRHDVHLAASKEGTNMYDHLLHSNDITLEGPVQSMATHSFPSLASHSSGEGHGAASSSRKTAAKSKQKPDTKPKDKKKRFDANDLPLLTKEKLHDTLAAYLQDSQPRMFDHLSSKQERETSSEEARLAGLKSGWLRHTRRKSEAAADEKKAPKLPQWKKLFSNIDEATLRSLNKKLDSIKSGNQKGSSWDIKDTMLTEEIAEITGEKGVKLLHKYQEVFPIIVDYWRRDPAVLLKLDQNPFKMDTKKFLEKLIEQLEGEAAS